MYVHTEVWLENFRLRKFLRDEGVNELTTMIVGFQSPFIIPFQAPVKSWAMYITKYDLGVEMQTGLKCARCEVLTAVLTKIPVIWLNDVL